MTIHRVRIGSLFTGYGGLDLAARSVLGGRVVWHCDNDKAASRLLAHHWPDVPNLGDITAVDWTRVERVHVLTGGFPCQDLSVAGNQAGLRPGTRSGLWSHFAYAIDQLRPGLVLIENVRGILSAAAHRDVEPCPWCVGGPESAEPPLRALGAVLGDLADIGFDAEWVGLPASAVGANHGRFREFLLAWPVGDTYGVGRQRPWDARGWRETSGLPWETGPPAGPVADTGCNAWAGVDADRPAAGRGRRPVSDTYSDALRTPEVTLAGCGGQAITEHAGDGRGLLGRVAVGVGRSLGDTLQHDSHGRHGPDVAWGIYEPAIRRWEAILGRPAPAPTEPAPRGGRRLAAPFVEHMMGLPEGHVTGVHGISRNDMLRLLGNGVVPQQAEAAIRALLAVRGEVAA